MKIFHTSDWHIGKFVNGFSMLEDQKYILTQLISSLEENHIDLLIISGDIFDRAIPPQEAIKILDDVIYTIISSLKINILIITGNHDSAQRLTFANKLYSKSGLHIIGDFNKKIPKITLKDEYGDINFYLLPYFTPLQINKMFSNNNYSEKESIKSFNTAFKTIIDYNKQFINLSSRNILIAHGFFGYFNQNSNKFNNQIISESELSVGGMDIIDISPANFFDYIALGHLHSPQKVNNNFFRYAGSLLKYSTDEANQNKSNIIISIKNKSDISLKFISFKPLRDLRIIRGFIKDLCATEDSLKLYSEDYIFVELLDKGTVFDAISRLKSTFPNIMGIKMVSNLVSSNKLITNKLEKKDCLTLFEEFYKDMKNEEMDEKKKNIISKIFMEIQNNQ